MIQRYVWCSIATLWVLTIKGLCGDYRTFSDGKYTFSYFWPSSASAGVTLTAHWRPYYGISPVPAGHLTLPSVIGGRPVVSITDLTDGLNTSYPPIDMSGVTGVTLPEHLKYMFKRSLCGTSVKHFSFPKTIKSIGGLGGSLELEEISIPDHVIAIADDAFEYCPKLRKMFIPNSVAYRGENYGADSEEVWPRANRHFDGIAHGCPLLEEVKVDPSPLGINFGTHCFSKCPSLRKFVILNDESYVGFAYGGDCAFKEAAVTNIYLNETMALSEIILGTNTWVVKKDGSFYGTFGYLENPKTVKMDFNRYSCKDVFFRGYTNIETVIIHEGTPALVQYAFQGCSSLRAVEIPGMVTNINASAFSKCTGLKDMTIPDSVKRLGDRAFYGCSGLTNVNFGQSLRVVGEDAFAKCSGLARALLPESVREIGPWSFSDCTGLASVTLQEGVTNIGRGAFTGCRGLTSLNLPDSVTCVGAYAFSKCVGLMRMAIPDGITSIEDGTFSGCRGLTSLTIPNRVTHIGARAFSDCGNLMRLSIPNSVTSIGDAAFSNCASLVSLKIPDGITNIGDFTFSDCAKLTRMVLPKGVTNIGYFAFMNCSRLKTVAIGGVVREILGWAFSGCRELVSISIPKSVNYIGAGAFKGCESLETVIVDEGDGVRVRGLMGRYGAGIDYQKVKFVERSNMPQIAGDDTTVVAGDAETGYIVMPSAERPEMEILIPNGIDATQVAVYVSPEVETVKPNGAIVRVVRDDVDITDYLNMPTPVDGVLHLSLATVKPEIARGALSPENGARIELSAENSVLTTSETKPGLIYRLYEGTTLDGMKQGASTIGDGKPWTPEIKVKGGTSGFYTIRVGK